jgi:hypothetical protein
MPERSISERVIFNLSVLSLYAALITGGIIGWKLTDSFAGVLFGVPAGAFLGGMALGLVWAAGWALRTAWRHLTRGA